MHFMKNLQTQPTELPYLYTAVFFYARLGRVAKTGRRVSATTAIHTGEGVRRDAGAVSTRSGAHVLTLMSGCVTCVVYVPYWRWRETRLQGCGTRGMPKGHSRWH